MRTHSESLRTISNLIFCFAICGCGVADNPSIPEVTPTAEESVTSPVPERPLDSESTGKKPKSTGVSKSETKASSDKVESVSYEAPYPDREDPFLAPKRGANSVAGGIGNSNDEIQLLGFANVGGQKAVFSINGMVVRIGEGGLESGIEVISIQPPAVVLQRNRQRWQASLDY